MVAWKCDKCGKYFEDFYFYTLKREFLRDYKIRQIGLVSDGGVAVKNFDLCPECTKEIVELIEQGESL